MNLDPDTFNQMKHQLATAVGFNSSSESVYLGTWDELLKIVEKDFDTLCEIRKVANR